MHTNSSKTGTFSFPNLREASFQKNTQHLCFWSCPVFFFFSSLSFLQTAYQHFSISKQ